MCLIGVAFSRENYSAANVPGGDVLDTVEKFMSLLARKQPYLGEWCHVLWFKTRKARDRKLV